MRTLLMFLIVSLPLIGHSQQPHFDVDWSKSFVVELNQIRESNSLPPLHFSKTLSKQCYAYSKSMAKRNKENPNNIEHANPKWLFISLYDGECIAFGDDPLQLWLNSPPHSRIMMDRSMKKIGVSCYGEYCTLRVKRD
jgi:uncharacterized protein YkwD